MCQAAGYIYKKLVNDGILNQAFSIAPVRSQTEVGYYISTTEGIAIFFISVTSLFLFFLLYCCFGRLIIKL